MSPPGNEIRFQPGIRAAFSNDSKTGRRGFSPFGVPDTPVFEVAVRAKVDVHFGFLPEGPSVYQRVICFLYLTFLERKTQRAVRFGGFRVQDKARGILVNAVDGIEPLSLRAELLCREGVQTRRVRIPAVRRDEKPGRFVQHHEMLVFIYNRK